MSEKRRYNLWSNSEMRRKAIFGTAATLIFWYFLPYSPTQPQKLSLILPQKEADIEEIIRVFDAPKIEVNHFYEYIINPALSNSTLLSLPYPPEPSIANQGRYVDAIDED